MRPHKRIMQQPITKVTESDVRRIALRDFGETGLSEAMDVLDNRPGEKCPRVRLALLKLSSGDMNLLKEHAVSAARDFRDVLALAEYPRWSKEIGFDKVPRALEREVIRADWLQYSQWLGRACKKCC